MERLLLNIMVTILLLLISLAASVIPYTLGLDIEPAILASFVSINIYAVTTNKYY